MCPECAPDHDGRDEHPDLGDSRFCGGELVEVQLELLTLVAGPAVMPLSWDFSVYWFASFAAADQRLAEQRRNKLRDRSTWHGPDSGWQAS
jgi:hypothetical protein